MSNIPKAILYYSKGSVASAAVLLTLYEKGYGEDEIDLKVVDLSKGENYSPTYLRLNPLSTVPTLVAPLENTLSEDVESRYKAVLTPKAIVDFLDKSRSPLSKRHTTSSAPAPSLTPATVAFASTVNILIDEVIYADASSAEALSFYNAQDDAQLKASASPIVSFLTGEKEALERYLSDTESNVTEKVKSLWRAKIAANSVLLGVYGNAGKADLDAQEALLRTEFFAESKRRWSALHDALLKLNKDMTGPFYFGDQISVLDVHVAAWFARIVKAAGGSASDDGATVVQKVEKHIGLTSPLSGEKKLVLFWDTVRTRPTWQKVYSEGLW